MSEHKTQPTGADPHAFVTAIEHPTRRADAQALLELMERVTGWQPRMWGPSIVGFGRYHYRYDSGREGDSLAVGFSHRKASLVIYLRPGYNDFTRERAALGKHKMGKSCVYVTRLADIDLTVLEQMIRSGLASLREQYEVFAD